VEPRRVRRAAAREAEKLAKSRPSVALRIAARVQKHWKALLAWIGVTCVWDLIREFVRGKAMDWLFSRLGSLGQWAVTYPFVFTTIAVAGVLLYIVVVVLREWTRQEESPVLDKYGNPFRHRALTTKQAFGFSGTTLVLIAILSYGMYRYYQTSITTLLDRYPLGYVIFDASSEKEIFPYKARGELASWNVDWTRVNYRRVSGGMIHIDVPDIDIPHFVSFHGNDFLCHEKVGPICNQGLLMSDGRIEMDAEILKITAKGTVLLFGFRYEEANQATVLPETSSNRIRDLPKAFRSFISESTRHTGTRTARWKSSMSIRRKSWNTKHFRFRANTPTDNFLV
jgi:hypothetical protein